MSRFKLGLDRLTDWLEARIVRVAFAMLIGMVLVALHHVLSGMVWLPFRRLTDVGLIAVVAGLHASIVVLASIANRGAFYASLEGEENLLGVDSLVPVRNARQWSPRHRHAKQREFAELGMMLITTLASFWLLGFDVLSRHYPDGDIWLVHLPALALVFYVELKYPVNNRLQAAAVALHVLTVAVLSWLLLSGPIGSFFAAIDYGFRELVQWAATICLIGTAAWLWARYSQEG